MSVGHYENFPVGSLLLPARLRRPVAVIYAFARSADDVADEGDLPPDERLHRLEQYRSELRDLQQNRTPQTPLFRGLAEVIRDFELPIEPFFLLLEAFSQDVTKTRYSDFPELLNYCRRSADPVGHLMLHLFGQATEEHLAWSDAICTSLQLINFWQDIAVDYRKNRIYLPAEDMRRFGVTEAQIAAGDTAGGWARLIGFEIARTRALMLSGAGLANRLPGRAGLEIGATVQGGLRVLEKIERSRGDIFRRRPTLRSWDWPLLLARAAMMA